MLYKCRCKVESPHLHGGLQYLKYYNTNHFFLAKLRFQNKCNKFSLVSIQKVHNSVSLSPHLTGNILCTSLNWKFCSFVSLVIISHWGDKSWNIWELQFIPEYLYNIPNTISFSKLMNSDDKYVLIGLSKYAKIVMSVFK
jgi:hypothetical protein